jgi:hypothetical protein
MKPLHLDVIAPLPEGWGMCLSCEMLLARANLDQAPAERGREEYPAQWQEDFRRLSEFVLNLATRYGDSILIQIFDPRSVQGLIKSIRYGARSYPTFIVASQEKVVGWDVNRLQQTLETLGAVEQKVIMP